MTGDPGAYSGTDGDPGAYARPDTDSPLDALLDAYVEASVNHYLASKGLLLRLELVKGFRDVHAARAAILAKFAMLEVERDFYLREAKFFSDQRDALRAEYEAVVRERDAARDAHDKVLDDLEPQLAALRAAQQGETFLVRNHYGGVVYLEGSQFTPGQRVRVTPIKEADHD